MCWCYSSIEMYFRLPQFVAFCFNASFCGLGAPWLRISPARAACAPQSTAYFVAVASVTIFIQNSILSSLLSILPGGFSYY